MAKAWQLCLHGAAASCIIIRSIYIYTYIYSIYNYLFIIIIFFSYIYYNYADTLGEYGPVPGPVQGTGVPGTIGA